MMGSNAGRAKGTMTALSLAMIVMLLVAVMFAAGVAEAKGGRGGGGGGGKPSGISSSKPSSDNPSSSGSATKNTSAKSSSSGLYNPSYGTRHGSLSNFFLWAWLFHDFDDDDYEEEYGESNAGFGGWAIMGVGAIGIWFLIRNLRRRFVS
jgi:hypothetical protein